jgi:hypothetical protein
MKYYIVASLAMLAAIGVRRAELPTPVSPKRAVVDGPCLTTEPGATEAVELMRHVLTVAGDSAELVAGGFPYNPANVEILADSTECAGVYASYVALFPPADTSHWPAPALHIAKASPPRVYMAYLPPRGDLSEVLMFFDSTYAYRTQLVGLK